jgi:DNA-binding NarL/FixJ family response regulator
MITDIVNMISVGIVEDDSEIRNSLRLYFEALPEFSFYGGYDSVEKLLNTLKKNPPPQVLIMDIGLPGMSGIEGIKLLKNQYPGIDIIVFSVYNDSGKIFESLCAGATGYLLKSAPFDEIREGIELLAKEGSPMSPQIARKVIDFFSKGTNAIKPASPLSEREKEVVVGLVDGLSYKLIGDRMHVSLETVRFHIKNIYSKLHVHSRSEVIRKSFKGEI